jgi:PadR family transcriptional regulator, regulatory protein AphA
MSIRHAILGFLSWKPFTGYELKKLFADSLSFHWSGNNNQIYGSLVELHKDGAVSIEVLQQEKLPAKKVYTITGLGREELREWLQGEPELPVVRNLAQIRLAWAEALDDRELDDLLGSYERLLVAQVIMCRETVRRGSLTPGRSGREKWLWRRIEEHRIAGFETELAWTRSLREELPGIQGASPAAEDREGGTT